MPTRLTPPLLPALPPVASLAVSHLEPQLDSHPEPPLSLLPEPHLALQLDSQLDGLPRLDSLLAVGHLVTDLVLRDLVTEVTVMETTVMDPSPLASPPSLLPALLPALLSALLPPCLLDSPSLPVFPLGSPVASPVARPLAVPSPFCLSRPRLLLPLVSRETSLVVTPAICCSRFCTLKLRSCNM